jgi:hypothetical protein
MLTRARRREIAVGTRGRARVTSRPRPPSEWAELPGTAGMRYSAAEVAHAMGLAPSTVVAWIKAGYLRASESTHGGYRIKHRAVRRALRDHPQVARAAMRAYERGLTPH